MTFSPRTWVAGETVSEAMMNTEVRDQFNSMFAAWPTYTPAWTASTTNPILGTSIITGRYLKVGRRVDVSVLLTTASGTGFGAGIYAFSVPFTAASATVPYLGTSRLTGADTWIGQTSLASGGTTFNCTFPSSATNTRGTNMGRNDPEVHAIGMILRASLTYQSAT
ncbi:hypothetical protein P3L51_24415 [Streptomyces sp. PSRA5]|uniref:hypothetical protein n=1 Tax=Streptomyces panacea TaxID=3035064 RepID=UPI00339CF136